ncbi:MAG TPA: carotenoid biosynthesis protein [Sporichthya sp.]|nr:carotenoid biosynthesis protein [Sporichthya sp.]
MTAPPRATTRRPDLLRASWALVAAAVACQIAYPLVEGTSRDRLTVGTAVVTFAAVLSHAVFRHGPAAAAVFGVVLAVAAGVETLGVHTGVPFGDYDYGGGLGAELAGVPLVIPAAWAMTAYPALLVARHLTRRASRPVTALVAGWALASWDVFLDPQMVEEGYWRWAHPDPALPGSPDVPLTNYAGWLVVSVLLMAVLDRVLPDAGRECAGGEDLLPGLLYLWTYVAQVVGNLVFFDRPAVALLGGLAMGAVALPYARALQSR